MDASHFDTFTWRIDHLKAALAWWTAAAVQANTARDEEDRLPSEPQTIECVGADVAAGESRFCMNAYVHVGDVRIFVAITVRVRDGEGVIRTHDSRDKTYVGE